MKAIQLVAERVEGKAKAKMEVTGPDGEQLQLLNMTDDQLDQRPYNKLGNAEFLGTLGILRLTANQ